MLAIGWTQLSAFAGSNNNVILNNCNGGFTANSLNALMGSSGSGKSTLLKCLNGSQKYSLSKESKIYVKNGSKTTVTFIHQQQEIMTALTVEQALTYSSKLNNSLHSGVDHKLVVSELMDELMISKVRKNRIANCSGGQIKRISIGLELTSVQKPNLLFIDEPTTGLDSFAAEKVIECLKRLTFVHKMTTIVSIHQPNNELFHMFDNIYVLAKGGVCVYSGEPKHLRQHLIDCEIECNENQVPIEVLVKTSFENINNSVSKLSARTIEFINISLNDLNDMKVLSKGLNKMSKPFNVFDFWYLLLRYFHRNFVSNFKIFSFQLILMTLMTAINLTIIDKKLYETDDCFKLNSLQNMTCAQQREQESNTSVNVVFTTVLIILSIDLIIFSFGLSSALDMRIVISEHKNSWYSASSAFCSKFIIDFILTILYSLCFTLVLQLLTGQITRPYSFFLVTLLANLSWQNIASTVGIAFSKNIRKVEVVLVVIFFFMVLFTDFLLKIDQDKYLLLKLSDLSINGYIFKMALILIYGFERCPKGYQSKQLIKYQLMEDIKYFDIYFQRLIIYFLATLLLKYLVFRLKLSNFNKFTSKLKFNHVKKSSDHTKIINISNKIISNKNESMNDRNQVFIAWKNLSFSTNSLFLKKRSILLLDNISGYFESNNLNALMGPSGAGKTTFIKCLSGTLQRGLSEETKIYYNSKKRLNSSFIEQNVCEHLLNGLTVRQTLLYASKLKNSRMMSGFNHNQNIEDLMTRLLIRDIQDIRVEKCSGGELKRIIIASELTIRLKPSLFCIDEPTSGLDSNAAENLISLLKEISTIYEMTTIVSIHQPNNELFHMFDNIYILAKGGVCVYSGPPTELRQHLIDCEVECNQNQTPIEVMIKVCTKDKSDPKIQNLIQKSSINIKDFETIEYLKANTGNRNPFIRFSFIDFYNLVMRNIALKYRRKWSEELHQILVQLMIASMLKIQVNSAITVPNGCLKLSSGLVCDQTLEDIRNEFLIKQNLIFNLLYMAFLMVFIVVIHSVKFCSDFTILRYENRNGWYSVGAYFWSKLLVDLVPDLISISLFAWIVSFYSDFRINGTFYLALLLATLCTESFCQMSAILFSKDSNLSIMFSIFLINIFLLLGNGIIPVNKLHYSLQAISEFNYLKFTYDLILISIYGFDRCNEKEISLVLYGLGIETQMFWPKVIRLVMITIFLKLFVLALLIIKIHYKLTDNQILTNKNTSKLNDIIF